MKLISYLLNLNRFYKQLFVISLDFIILQVTLYISLFIFISDYGLTKNKDWVFFYTSDYFYISPDFYPLFSLSLIFIAVFLLNGIYNSIFRFIGFLSLLNLFKSSIYSLLIFTIFSYLYSYLLGLNYLNQLSIYFFLFYSLLIFVFVSLNHILIKNIIRLIIQRKRIDKILIYGAGSGGYLISKQLQNDYKIIAFIDDDKKKIGNRINNITINSFEFCNKLILSKSVDKVFIAIPSIQNKQKQKIIKKLINLDIPFKFIYPLEDSKYVYKKNSNYENISINDLIDRKIGWQPKLIEKIFKNQTIIITGAGGSIGSELSKVLNSFSLKKLILIDHSEINLFNLQYNIGISLSKSSIKNKVLYYLGSITDVDFLNKIFQSHNPDYIFHAAAYKHVTLCEENIVKCLQNNFIATTELVKKSLQYRLKHFIFISTDKAVKSTNIMGCSKKLSELYIKDNFSSEQSATGFSILRFGNVIGSAGSVYELFQKQIDNNGPLTLTHREVTRFFMTTNDAVRLVLQSIVLKEKNEIFILKMGDPIKIYNLAKKMIFSSGKKIKEKFNNDDEIEIKIIGLRPGEKLHEQLVVDNRILPTSHSDIMKEDVKYELKININDILEEILKNIQSNNTKKIYEILQKNKLLFKI